ncbi:uncharacterized protein [Lolium perenne]|uniref:uncharacterized protein n=1 Tax=Lolium perenne TaxID=4522 RepID=UPI0021F51F36|nr:uncharacterized protein LOC127329349 [Lolium perenne]
MADSDGEASPARHLANTSVQFLPDPPTMDDIDITRFIKFKLDAEIGNYNMWRKFFLFVLSKFDARDHVEEETDPHLADAAWRSADVDIVIWIYITISDELQDVILKADSTAFTAWRALEHFFTENAEGREIHLDKEFHNIKQGDMGVIAYCRKLKGVADQLGDVGAPITDKKLTMRLIDGLDRQSRLQLAEQKLKAEEADPPQVLHANANNTDAPGFRFNGNCYACGVPEHMARHYTTRGGDRSQNSGRGGGSQQGRGGGHPTYGGQNNYGGQNSYGGGQNNYGGQNYRGRGRGRGHGDHGGRDAYNPGYGHHPQQYGSPQPGYTPPSHQWVPPNASGVLGARPGMPQHVYHTVAPTPAPPLQSVLMPPAAHTYNYAAMFNSAPSNTGGLHPGGEWVMDSGATTHVTNNQEFDPFDLFVKDLASRKILMRSSSSGELYPFFGDIHSSPAALTCSVSLLQPRTKHVEIDLHFVRDRVTLGEVKVLHVPSSSQFADVFTKGLPTPVFQDFRYSLNIVPSDVQPEGGC